MIRSRDSHLDISCRVQVGIQTRRRALLQVDPGGRCASVWCSAHGRISQAEAQLREAVLRKRWRRLEAKPHAEGCAEK